MAFSLANQTLRRRIETVIRLAAPMLDVGLAVGDRLSRLTQRDGPARAPARMAREGESAPRGLRGRPAHGPH